MKNFAKKISGILKTVFGYGIMICLFLGGFSFFGYVAALFIGGDVAATICEFIYKSFYPVVIKASVILVLLGLVAMYLNGETALTANKKANDKMAQRDCAFFIVIFRRL